MYSMYLMDSKDLEMSNHMGYKNQQIIFSLNYKLKI